MTGTRIDIALDDAALAAAFARLRELAQDPAPLLREIGDNLTEMRRARFLRGAGPNRAPWKAKRRPDGRPILVRQGRLRDTLAWQVEGATLLIGSDLPYAAIHEFGGEVTLRAVSRKLSFTRDKDGRSRFAKRGTKGAGVRPVTYGERVVRIPARPFLAADAEDSDEIADVVARHMRRLVPEIAP